MKSYSLWTLEEGRSNFVVITVFADCLALLGARPSAGTEMTKIPFCVYTGMALEIFMRCNTALK